MSSNLGNDTFKVASGEARTEVTFGTMKRKHESNRNHRDFAGGAVRLVLNVAIRKPSKKHAAIFRVFVGDGLRFKLFAKFIVFCFQTLILAFKPIVFFLEVLQLLAKENKSFLNDRGTSVLSDKGVEVFK